MTATAEAGAHAAATAADRAVTADLDLARRDSRLAFEQAARLQLDREGSLARPFVSRASAMRYPLKAGLFTLVVLAAGCGVAAGAPRRRRPRPHPPPRRRPASAAAAVVERRRGQEGDRRFVDRRDPARADRTSCRRRAHRGLRQRRHAVGGEAGAVPGALRLRSRQGAGPAASRVEDATSRSRRC